jgi:membrane protein YdbS with pleckstrin-like domain
MQAQIFKPSPRYLTKLRLVITIVALLILVGGILLGWLIGHDSEVDASDVMMIYVIIAGADLLWCVPALILTGPYFRSLSYEVQDDEVIVRVGIWTHSVKHVPYRTVTNLTVKRDILDRWLFGLGTLNVQTAGMSGTTGAEESLVGLPNVQEVYDIVVTELRRFRGGMAPTAAEVEARGMDARAIEPAVTSPDTLSAILAEVRAIRQKLETGEKSS